MKTNRQTTLIAMVLSAAVLNAAGCTEKARPPENSTSTAETIAATTPTADLPVPNAKTAAFGQWQDLKTCTYDAGARLFAGLKLMEATVDAQLGELTARRATLNQHATDLREWDFAMKEMVNARSYFQGMNDEMRHATRENWDQQKDKVGSAWVRTQEAYAKVKSSTTQ